MPLNNEALERLSRKSSHAYKPREGVEINRASTIQRAVFAYPTSYGWAGSLARKMPGRQRPNLLQANDL